jgi:hypothetical protein
LSDPNTWGGFAFKDGLCLLLDEVNLAPQSVLQCMEAAINSQQISIEISGLIAPQDPDAKRFALKRETLTTKFLSRFTPIAFPEISG